MGRQDRRGEADAIVALPSRSRWTAHWRQPDANACRSLKPCVLGGLLSERGRCYALIS